MAERATEVWAGVDVGAPRKGFHAAVVDRRRVVDVLRPPGRLGSPREVLDWLDRWPVRLVAVDSPCALAGPGGRRRDAERRVAREVCGIRYTPSADDLARQKRGSSPRFYDWIEAGLGLYAALRRAGYGGRVVECFPTASWTRWAGLRDGRSRAAWSARALERLGLGGVPPRLGQDARDAIAAAVTAREHADRATERFGDIVIPRGPRP